MRVVFAGTPEFAAAALGAILDAGHVVPLVLTQPDRPAGRGMALQASPVKRLALEHGLAVHQPPSLKSDEARRPLQEAAADVMVVAAYGLILPRAVLDLPRLGCLNIHASLLPRWRGAAPIQRALLAGDKETGITIMQMDAGLDTGPMLLARALPIAADDTAQTLHDKLAALGAELIVQALDGLERGSLAPRPQPSEGVTYAAKLDKTEAAIDWRRPAADIARAVRAFNPSPGAYTRLGETTIKVWAARPEDGSAGAPGTVLEASPAGIRVACGQGSLRLEILQRPGGRPLAAAEFLRGFALAPGSRFELPAA